VDETMKLSAPTTTERLPRGQRKDARGRRRTQAKLEQDYASIAGLMLNGVSNREIGRQLGLSHPQVALDIQHVIEGWVKDRNHTITQHKAIELTKLDRLEATILTAFNESRRVGKDGKVISAGSPKLLELLMKIIFERMHVHGVYAAAAIEHRHSGDVNHQVNYRMAEADRILEAAYGSAPALPATTSDDDIIIDGVVEPLTVAVEIQ